MLERCPVSVDLWRSASGKLKRLDQVIRSMGELVAWSHLRIGGRSGSAITDEWICFGTRSDWQAPLMMHAQHQAAKISSDWMQYYCGFDRHCAFGC